MRLRLIAGRRAARARCAAGALLVALAAIVCVALAPSVVRAGENDGAWERLGPPNLQDLPQGAFFDPLHHRLLSLEREENGTYSLWTYGMGSGTWNSTRGIPLGPFSPYAISFALDPEGERILAVGPIEEYYEEGRPPSAVGVWSLDLTAPAGWDSLAVTGPRPSERGQPSLTLDRVGRRLFMVGGYDVREEFSYGDVWELTLGGTPSWSATPIVGPALPGITGAQLAFGSAAQRLVMIGGRDSLQGNEFIGVRARAVDLAGDRRWRSLAVGDTVWNVSQDAPIVGDPSTGLVRVLRGAYTCCPPNPPPDSSYFWVLDPAGAGSWRQEAFAGSERVVVGSNHALFIDEATDHIVLLGGYGSSSNFQAISDERADVWTVALGSGGTLNREFSSVRGGRASSFAPFVHDPTRRKVWGIQATRSTGDMYGYPLAQSGVVDFYRGTTPAPSARYGAASVFDPPGNRAIVFGGSYIGFELGDLWEVSYSFSPARWRRLLPEGPFPGPRFGASAVYDPLRRRMIMYGGYAGHALDELWELDLSRPDPVWRQLTPPGSTPAARFYHAAVYDSRRDGMIVHGGAIGSLNNISALRDAWMLSFADGDLWVPITSGGAYRYAHGAVYDPVGDRMITLYGRDVAGLRFDMQALELAGGAHWVPFAPEGSGPLPNFFASAFYDAPEDRLLVYTGGASLDFPRLDRSWEIRFTRDTSGPPPLAEGPPLRLLGVGPNPSKGDVLVSFQIPHSTEVRLRLYDVRGRLVRDFGERSFLPGVHVLRWDGTGDDGTRLRDGVYFARLAVEDQVFSGKLVLMD